MTYELTIKKIQNGFILEIPGDDAEEPHVEVIEEIAAVPDEELFGTNDETKIAIGKLLARVAEYFGVHYDKFSEDNLKISFDKKGHKMD
ncbi:MAG: hypothetical protein AAB539_02105 [Patescibacteria group bacterium]